MRHPWPGTPGGYVPVAWISLIKEAALREKMRATQQKQKCYTNLRDIQGGKK